MSKEKTIFDKITKLREKKGGKFSIEDISEIAKASKVNIETEGEVWEKEDDQPSEEES
ncbi:hypothetical protein ISR94_00160 [Candidatus Microgenomates bacterium]|nr:hypothetical protein [Candidatus Microgenomates bacterium]